MGFVKFFAGMMLVVVSVLMLPVMAILVAVSGGLYFLFKMVYDFCISVITAFYQGFSRSYHKQHSKNQSSPGGDVS